LLLRQEASRRDALAGIAAAGAALVPSIANAAAGESPRFSVFGLVGDGSSYSEGAAYGTDQSAPLYSPYSVYGEAGPDSLYKPGDDQYVKRKKAVLAETAKRLDKLPAYVKKAKWFEVTDELSRYMYETRGAVTYLAKDKKQKDAAADFFKAIEKIGGGARYKKAEVCDSGIAEAKSALDAFVKTL
jgi:photosystem II oxygen-evolving enhancer protein 3